MPIGRLFLEKPQGIEIAGMPLKFAEIVKISDKYIDIGSLVFSPILKAVVGVVGVTIASTS